MTKNNETHEVDWLRNIILFLSSQTISLFGSSLVQYAMMWHITLTTESGSMMTLYIICGFIPTFLLSPFAGVWADRFNRKQLIIAADAMIAAATLILALLFMNGYNDMWLLFAMAAVRALGAAVQTPAVGAILPQIVPREQLTSVNGVNSSVQGVIMFVSPMVSAALLGSIRLEYIFMIDVITALTAIATLLLLKITTHQKATEAQTTSYLEDFLLGVKYVMQNQFLKVFFVFLASFNLLMGPAAFLTPLQVTRNYGEDVWRLSAIEIAFSVGMMGGGLAIASWKGFSNRIKTVGLGCIIMSLSTIGLGVAPTFWLLLLSMALFGVAMPVFNTPATVLLQENVAESYLGRVFGVLSMISTSMMPIGMLVFGPLADYVEIEWLLLSSGTVLLALSILLMRHPILLKIGAAQEIENRAS